MNRMYFQSRTIPKSMPLEVTKKQMGILRGMGIGLSTSILLSLYSITYNPLSFPKSMQLEDKLFVLGLSLSVPSFFLILSIARIAQHRFFSPIDIDSTAKNSSSKPLHCLQSILQNTLEQTALATIVYFLWILMTPSAWLSALPLSAGCFFYGRILFIKGFQKGASSRALGFALTFYPLVIMFILILFSTIRSLTSL